MPAHYLVVQMEKDISYKMIYWWGINIGDWRFYEEIVNIKFTIFVSI